MTQVTSLNIAMLIQEGKAADAVKLIKAQHLDNALDLTVKTVDLLTIDQFIEFQAALRVPPAEPNQVWERVAGDPLSQAGQRINIRI